MGLPTCLSVEPVASRPGAPGQKLRVQAGLLCAASRNSGALPAGTGTTRGRHVCGEVEEGGACVEMQGRWAVDGYWEGSGRCRGRRGQSVRGVSGQYTSALADVI